MIKAGEIYYTSWGYSMTLNDFIKIVSVSKTGKTVIAMRIGSKSDSTIHHPGGGRSKANPEVELEDHGTFRLYVRKGYDGKPVLRGKYPFAGPNSKRMGTFWKDSGESHYENHWD